MSSMDVGAATAFVDSGSRALTSRRNASMPLARSWGSVPLAPR